jgi:hypothetical protein
MPFLVPVLLLLGVAGGVAYWVEKIAKPAPKPLTTTVTSPWGNLTVSAPPAGASSSYSGGSTITLIPNQPVQSEGLHMGESVTVQVPPGARWASPQPALGWQPPADPQGPIT